MSVSPSLNLPVLRQGLRQGLRAKQSLATCSPPALLYRSRTRHPPLRLSCCARTAVAQTPLQLGPPSDFFNRTLEQKKLKARLASEPTGILVITGPRSSGKSALIREVLAQGQPGVKALIDGRSAHLATPQDLRRALTAGDGVVLQMIGWLKERLDDKSLLKAFSPFAATLVGRKLDANDPAVITEMVKSAVAGFSIGSSASMAVVVDVIEKLCAACKEEAAASGSWPVFVFDEVNMLMQWQKGDKAEQDDLQSLLACLVKVSKQENQAHVVLATSDYSFTKWLEQEIGDKFYEVEVVGDFPEAEAREFFQTLLQQGAVQALVLPDDGWAKVHAVCGGNPGDLRKVAVKLRNAPSLQSAELDAALEGVYAHLMSKVATAAINGQGWAPRLYLTAMQQLLQSDHGAVEEADLQKALGDDGTAVAALLAMMKRGLLGVRASSGWARDLPPEAFGGKKRVFMAASVAHLYCMRCVFGERGEGAAERLRALQEGNAGSQEMAGAAAAEDDAIAKVQRDIERVEQAISENEQQQASVKAAKEEGWREELQRLGEDKKRLGKKEQSLREEKQSLREKELLLMRAQTGGA